MIEKIEFAEYLDNLPKYIEENNKDKFVLIESSRTYVLIGKDEINEEYCKQNNFPILKTHKFGGTIVNFEGDLCLCNYSPNSEDTFGNDCMVILKDYLASKGINAIIDHNDVLIDGTGKVASWTSTWLGKCLYSALHISVNMNIEYIKNICTKPMLKIPTALADYNITTEEIEDLYITKLEERCNG